MTTDTKPKYVGVEIEIGGKTVTIGGMCKGSGMIHPNMCTMLGFVTTDAAITKELLQKALSDDVLSLIHILWMIFICGRNSGRLSGGKSLEEM